MKIYFEKDPYSTTGSLGEIMSDLEVHLSKHFDVEAKLYRGADVSISNFLQSTHEKDYFFKKHTYNILIQPMDGTVISPWHVNHINNFNLIITPSKRGVELLEDSGVAIPIVVIPNYFKEIETQNNDINNKTGDKITFYHESTLNIRKNFIGLYESFISSFADTDVYNQVRLVIKTESTNVIDNHAEDIENIKSMYTNLPEVIIMKDYVEEPELVKLWQEADIYISFAHMEGFGIPLLNFAAMGKPIVTLDSRNSGYMDFLNKDNSYLVESKIFNKSGGFLIFDKECSEWEDIAELSSSCKVIMQAFRDVKDGVAKTVKYESLSRFNKDVVMQKYLDVITSVSLGKYPKIPIINNQVQSRIFKTKCKALIPSVRYFDIPKFKTKSDKCAVIVEGRILPHIEFILRQVARNLDETWSMIVYCGDDNHDYMKKLCEEIGNINVINLHINNLSVDGYSELLMSASFWCEIPSEKVLIFQHDSLLFRKGINKFLEYDYIGAPWPWRNVGNGGLSLRSKSKMLEVIENINTKTIVIPEGVNNHMKINNIKTIPEDVYFADGLLKIGANVAPFEVANEFSIESIGHPNPLGGHQFWVGNSNWVALLKNSIEMFDEITLFGGKFIHRSGWNYVRRILEPFSCERNRMLIDNSFINRVDNDSNNIKLHHFSDLCGLLYNFSLFEKTKKPWVGFFHLCPAELDILKTKPSFIEDMRFCKGIFTLSEYLKKYLKKMFKDMKIRVPIEVLYHPTEDCPIKFDMGKYLANKDKKIIHIGHQYRRLCSIYELKTNHSKIWLNSNNLSMVLEDLEKDMVKNNIKKLDKDSVKIMNLSNKDYDLYLSENICFIDVYDSSVNNAVIECIMRNTPIFANKHPAIIEYLGEDYPLLYNNLEEVEKMLKDDRVIKSAHKYLVENKYLKDRLNGETFVRKLANSKIINNVLMQKLIKNK